MFDEVEFYDTEFTTQQLEEIDELASDIMVSLDGHDLSICYEAITICYEMLESAEKQHFQDIDTKGLNGYDANKDRGEQ